MSRAGSERVLWLGRVVSRDAGACSERVVRIWTDGRAPTDDDVAEEISDPFEAAQLRRGAAPDADVAHLAARLPAVEGGAVRVGDVTLAAPVRPGKIVCVGRNYRAHAAELGNEVPSEPLLFYKPSSSLLPSGAAIELPAGFERIDMESELVLVVGRRGRRLSRESALDVVVGYTLGNDVSCRDLQRRDKQWTRAKGFDTFAPLGPWVRVVDRGAAPPAGARIQGRLDGELRQDAPLSDMVFDFATVLEYVSEYLTVEPGDLIYTGTPEGVSPLSPGHNVEISLDGWDLGRLANPVRTRR